MPVEIPVYEYRVRTRPGEMVVLTFREREGVAPVAVIIAPDGSTLYSPADKSAPRLKVPRPDRPFEFDLFDAAEALVNAGANYFGLSLAPSLGGGRDAG